MPDAALRSVVRVLTVLTLVAGILAGETIAAAQTTVCGAHYCDGRDPGLARGERFPVGEVTIFGRGIRLHMSDADNMGWASIRNGSPNDEVWLDRSWDGGKSWSQGSKLGYTKIPAGRSDWRTLMYNVDDPNAKQVGALRACGKAGDRGEIVCTSWARSTVNAGTRIDAAATALMGLYDYGTGWVPSTGWWNTANAITAIVDHSALTGSTAYRYAIANTYDRNRNAHLGEFRNDYVDDTGWWGLAWLRAYDLTGDQRYLNTAKIDADYMYSFWDDTCGGGLWWSTARNYKNAVTNELFIKLAAALHNRIPGDTTYLDRAKRTWTWFRNSGMINGDNLVNDGLNTSTCKNNGDTTWTYNQGTVLGGLLELHRATGDAELIQQARRIADAATTRLVNNGILTDPCEYECGGESLASFKGVFVRNLGELDRSLSERPYRSFLTRQTDTMYAANRTSLDQYGLHWAGPADAVDGARQHSALDAFNATQ
ncbi:glycoside hydrolase family 76 protein [Streptomyces sp. KR80]|uniref:glycoside hydrolase family 76 protein n=1 Tax=Streptomyces sp. KR80 TaxID=3457426 RepID=UPI003FD2C428